MKRYHGIGEIITNLRRMAWHYITQNELLTKRGGLICGGRFIGLELFS